MRSWFTRLFSGTPNRPQASRRARLGLEALEQRDLMSGVPLTWTAPATPNTANTVTLAVVGNNLDVFDNDVVVKQQAISATSAVNLTGGGASPTFFNIQATLSGIPTTVNFAAKYDSATLGLLNSLQSIHGAVTIQGFQGSGQVILNASADSGVNPVTISSTSITGLSPATVNYNQLNWVNVTGRSTGTTQYTVTGSPGTVDLNLQSSTDWAVVSSTSNTVVVFGHAGNIASLHGASTGVNAFSAWSGWATLSGTGYYDMVGGFGQVYAFSHSARDVANFYGAGSGVNTLTAQKGYAYMVGPGYNNESLGFWRTNATSNSAQDSATLWNVAIAGDSTQVNGDGSGWISSVYHFPKVTAYGNGGAYQGSDFPDDHFDALLGTYDDYGSYNSYPQFQLYPGSLLFAKGSGNIFTSDGNVSVLSGPGYTIQMVDAHSLLNAFAEDASSSYTAFLNATGPTTMAKLFNPGPYMDTLAGVVQIPSSTPYTSPPSRVAVYGATGIAAYGKTWVSSVGNPFPAGTTSTGVTNFFGGTYTLYAWVDGWRFEQLGPQGWH